MLRASPLPTAAELMILRVLWRRGPCTVRQVQEELERDRPTGYTTALKMLQIMFEKGLVQRDESARSHVYQARASELQTKRALIRDLVDKAFDGSPVQLIEHVLALKRPTRAEAAEIRAMIKPVDEPRKAAPAAPVAPAPPDAGTAATPEVPSDAPGVPDDPEPGRLF